jgi:lipopolysaccharide transport system ATP-binding protein
MMTLVQPTTGDSYIKLDDVSVEFPIYSSHGRSFKKTFLSMAVGGGVNVGTNDRVSIQALKGITLDMRHGERIGLVGHNGSGKSTLLRTLAGVYEPTFGDIAIYGKVSTLIDLTIGMDMEATGYENIKLRSVLSGLKVNNYEAYMAEVAESTELGDFLSMPVRTYSSGMMLRLAFSISTSIVPDILLMDEWIGVGDASFVNKAQARLKNLVGQSGILVIASHDTRLIEEMCTRAIWLDKGVVRGDGKPADVLRQYNEHSSLNG